MEKKTIKSRLQKYAKRILFLVIYLAFAFSSFGQVTQDYSDLGEGVSAGDTLTTGSSPFVFDSLSYQIVEFVGTGADAVLVWKSGSSISVKRSGDVKMTRFSIKNIGSDAFTANSILMSSSGSTFSVEGYKAGSSTGQIVPSASGVVELEFTNIDELQFWGDSLVFDFDDFTYTKGSTNTTPDLTISSSNLNYTENDAATQIDANGIVQDVDGDAEWDGGSLDAQITNNDHTADVISIKDTDGDVISLTISNSNLMANGVDVADLSNSGGTVTGGDKLSIIFDSDANNSIVLEVLQSLRYHNTSANPGSLDKSLSITAIDKDSASVTRVRTISITTINNAPVVENNEGIELNEGATSPITDSFLRVSDPDDRGDELIFTITSLPSKGTLFVDNNDNDIADDTSEKIGLNETFTHDDIDNGRLKYTHDDSESTSDSFVFSLADGGEDGVLPIEDQTFSISVTPVNDHTPVISNGQTYTIEENAPKSTIVATVSASDTDEGTIFSNWTITGGNPDGTFRIASSSGEISVADNSSLDFESKTSYTLQLTVSDGSNTSAVEDVEVNVLDANDNKPIIAASQEFVIDENPTSGYVLGTLTASDSDAGSELSNWTIVSGNSDSAFAIDAANGQISVNNSIAIDREAREKFILQLTVSDGELVSTNGNVTIRLNDLNDNLPVIAPNQTLNIDENSNGGAVIGTISATDADVTPTTIQDWTISDLVDLNGNGNNAIAINSATGQLTVSDPTDFDCETTQSFSIMVSASDGTGFGDEEEVTININDVNEFPPSIVPSQSFIVDENSTTIGTVEVEDQDAQSKLHDCTIISGNINDIFQINPETREITVAGNSTLDFETTSQYTLSITVNDGETTSEAGTLSITVNDVNEKPIAVVGKSRFVDEGTRVELDGSNSSDPEGETLEYRWTAPAGIAISDIYDAQPTFIAPEVYETTDFEIGLIVNDGVLDSEVDLLTITVGLVTGISDDVDTNDEDLVLYPNPSDGAFTLDLDHISNDGALVSFTDVNARLIHSQTVYEKKTIFNLSLASGMYILKVEQDGKTSIKKIIVE